MYIDREAREFVEKINRIFARNMRKKRAETKEAEFGWKIHEANLDK